MKANTTISMAMSKEEDLRSRLHLHLNQDGGNPSQLLEMLERAVRLEIWKSFDMTFDEFVETPFEQGGLGWSKNGLKAVRYLKHRYEGREDVAERMKRLRTTLEKLSSIKLDPMLDRALLPEPERIKNEGRPPAENRDNCPSFNNRSNSADYLTARIARDRPDILEDMKAGQYRSTRQAAIAAGIITPKTRINVDGEDMEKAANLLVKRLDPDQLIELIDNIARKLDQTIGAK